MKYVTEYRDQEAVKGIAAKIAETAGDQPINLMEVCGTHTMAIARFGIKELLPSNVKLISGPGCPVCVTPNHYIDHAIALSREPNIIIATFGDMIRVPGSTSSFEKEKADGRNIQIVYSPLDSIELAKKNPDKEVVFLSVGFETTIPTIASTLLMAKAQGITNLSYLTANKVVPPALEALIQGELKLNGFILPGHVSTIIGAKAYEKVVSHYHIPCSIAGFEPTDMMAAILDLVEQTINNDPKLSIKYRRVVTQEGNLKAQQAIKDVFESCDAEWRGVGTIPGSGLKLRKEFESFDASQKFNVDVEETRIDKGCICGSILQGLKSPADCPLFGKKCLPENPVGACMVSSEGTCAAHYKYVF